MPSRLVNGARVFYRAIGQSDGTAVLLIHGAMADGPTDWAAIAPVLGLSRRVIVPDCRGHGRSTNPDGGYSFRQMASDLAELIGRIAGRAHVVGHSNGGNVALVMAVEHPDVLASCVVQGGNAYVSEDILAAAPRIFDPERVEREDPAWRAQLVGLHDRWRGRDAWRRLLELTGRETVSAPNYGPADLAAISVPTLVVEGRDDRLNAASGHGAFMAANIPDAELWRPEAVGHAVHEERPTEWLRRVEDFWARRGTTAGDAVWRLGHGRFRDRRSSVFDVELPPSEAESPSVVVLPEAAEDVRARIPGEARITALRPESPTTVRAGIADVRSAPGDDGERVSQVLYGERVERFDLAGSDRRVRISADGYLGWVRDAALAVDDASAVATHRIVVDHAVVLDGPAGSPLLRLPFGARVVALAEDGDWLEIAGPQQGPAWIPRRSVRPAGEHLPLDEALRRFMSLVGVPYLWGGRSPWGYDCSGLAQRIHDEQGIHIPRDADQQWAAGRPVDLPARPGDLLFFSNPGAADPSIRHVAIALDGSRILHAWGAAGAVVVSRLSPPEDPRVAAMVGAMRGVRRFTSGGDHDG